MEFEFQKQSVIELKKLIYSDRHSILLEGFSGSGKTYLASTCKNYLDTDNVVQIQPSVDNLKNSIDKCYEISDTVLVIIENLDTVTVKSAYVLLKFLEEPKSNVYIIVTCRNSKLIPDTIISRSAVVTLGHPTDEDISRYAKYKNEEKYNELRNISIWKIVRSFNDVDKLYNLDTSKLLYLKELSENISFKDIISNMIWNLMHYRDNSDMDLDILFRCILNQSKDINIKKNCIDALKDIQLNRLSQFAIVSKFLFECKYGGGQ